MAYFTPLEYEPFSHTRGQVPEYDSYEGVYGYGGYNKSTLDDWHAQQDQAQSKAFEGYSGDQFQSLFDAVNDLGRNPAMTGQMFSGAPKYAPYRGTRADFTNPVTKTRQVWDNDANMQAGGYVDQPYQDSVFDQKGYLDARFGNMNNYLNSLGSYFGNMGAPQSASAQQILANAPGQGPLQPMPSIGNSSLNIAGGGNISANNPFGSFGLQSGGWGTAPTSLFGAGAGNANNP